MIFPAQNIRIVVSAKPIDFRRGHDGLVALVQAELGLDPHSGVVVVSLRRSFQLPTTPAAPISAPISISVNRKSPRQMTVLPGGGSLERAR